MCRCTNFVIITILPQCMQCYYDTTSVVLPLSDNPRLTDRPKKELKEAISDDEVRSKLVSSILLRPV